MSMDLPPGAAQTESRFGRSALLPPLQHRFARFLWGLRLPFSLLRVALRDGGIRPHFVRTGFFSSGITLGTALLLIIHPTTRGLFEKDDERDAELALAQEPELPTPLTPPTPPSSRAMDAAAVGLKASAMLTESRQLRDEVRRLVKAQEGGGKKKETVERLGSVEEAVSALVEELKAPPRERARLTRDEVASEEEEQRQRREELVAALAGLRESLALPEGALSGGEDVPPPARVRKVSRLVRGVVLEGAAPSDGVSEDEATSGLAAGAKRGASGADGVSGSAPGAKQGAPGASGSVLSAKQGAEGASGSGGEPGAEDELGADDESDAEDEPDVDDEAAASAGPKRGAPADPADEEISEADARAHLRQVEGELGVASAALRKIRSEIAAERVRQRKEVEQRSFVQRVVMAPFIHRTVRLLLALYAALVVVEWLVLALSRDYQDQLMRRLSLATGMPPDDPERVPRVRLDVRWLWRRLKRRFRGWYLFGVGMLFIWCLGWLPWVGDYVVPIGTALWSAYWLAVFTLAKSAVAWDDSETRQPWYVLAYEGTVGRIFFFGWYGKLLRRLSRSVLAPCQAFERRPYEAMGLALGRLLLSLPPVYAFVRPVFTVAAQHAVRSPTEVLATPVVAPR